MEKQRITGKEIRDKLRANGLMKGFEKICCGGKKQYSKDYAKQLRMLQMRGTWAITENGIIVEIVTV